MHKGAKRGGADAMGYGYIRTSAALPTPPRFHSRHIIRPILLPEVQHDRTHARARARAAEALPQPWDKIDVPRFCTLDIVPKRVRVVKADSHVHFDNCGSTL